MRVITSAVAITFLTIRVIGALIAETTPIGKVAEAVDTNPTKKAVSDGTIIARTIVVGDVVTKEEVLELIIGREKAHHYTRSLRLENLESLISHGVSNIKMIMMGDPNRSFLNTQIKYANTSVNSSQVISVSKT